MAAPFEAFFLSVDGECAGRRFCLFHPAQGRSQRGAMLYIHPFAEEMNKSRRMVALQARALSQAGYAVLQVDLSGCGDSSGDFGDATWQGWINDVIQAAQWLIERCDGQLWLWGLRAGCLLAAQSAGLVAAPCNFMFWAPAPSGKLLLQQFLRLKAAGDMLAGNAKGVTEGLRAQLAAGETIEVAGYALAPGLADGLEQARLTPPRRADPHGPAARVEWFEMSTRSDATPSPASSAASASWTQAGFSVRSHIVFGASFWQTAEIEEVPALVPATVAAVAPIQQTATA